MDLIFVTAYCPTEEQVERLNKCIDHLLVVGFDICIISHTPVPLHIQEKVKFYIYDSENDLSDDNDLKHSEYYFGKDYVIKSKLFKKVPFYGFAIYRMFSIVSGLAKSLGYQKIYHVEYDYLIKDPNIFINHKKILDTYDSVFYGSEPGENIKGNFNLILGGLKSFRVDNLPKLFCNFNRAEMEKRIKEERLIPLENFTTKIFTESGNPFFIEQKWLKDRVEIKKFINQELNWTIYYNLDNDFLGFFYLNYFEDCKITIIINDSEELVIDFKKSDIKRYDIKKYNLINSLKILRNSIIIFDQNINDDLIKKLKSDSIVKSK
jgi:hypothetical protein